MNELSEKELFKYLNNKRVVIVGPAPEEEYVAGFGEYIDSFDVVVRVNRGWRMSKQNPEVFGFKTNILYHCLDFDEENGGYIDYDFLKKSKCETIVSCYPNINDINHRDIMFNMGIRQHCFELFLKQNGGVDYSFVSDGFYLNLDSKMNTRPNSGTVAFLHLLQSNLSHLEIIGFSFFSKGYVDSYRSSIDGISAKDAEHSEHLVLDRMRKAQNHNIKRQIDFCKPVLTNDSRVSFSKSMKKVLNEK
jgi:hypothetical protein|tara:strand:- start:537 stop:1277 length:741 start_codon:yes stop_codon:yes gene_type:complete